MNMDDVWAIADRAYNKEVKTIKSRTTGRRRKQLLAKLPSATDRVVSFLQKEQEMEKAAEEKKRNEAIEELVNEQKAQKQEEQM